MTDLAGQDLNARMLPAVDRLARQFLVPRDTVWSYIQESLARWRGARVTTYVPLLAERSAKRRLLELRWSKAS